VPPRVIGATGRSPTRSPTPHRRFASLVAHVRTLAEAKRCAPGQIALAWLPAQQPWIVPIPGTRRRERVDEDAGATQVALSTDEVADLDTLAARIGVQGNRYNAGGMAMVGL
jgi:aryl-alcohol dehydrogenase-like predicted oxidoreductase